MNLQHHPLMTGYKYYFTTLSRTQQRVYIDLYKALCKYEKNVTTIKTDNLAEIVEMIVADNPLIFFFRQYSCVSFANKTTVTFDYLVSESEALEIVETLYDRVKSITEQVEGASDFEKELHFHDFFARNITYNNKFPKYSFMTIGALLYGSAVCAGISSAFKLLCDYVKIPCIVVHGESKKEAHAWNKVCIQNHFYNVDVTYDTTLSDGGSIRYDYFNVPDIWLSERKETMLTMQCNATRHNYHIVNGIYFNNNEQLKNYIFDKLSTTRSLNLRIDRSLFEDELENELEELIRKAHQRICCFSTYTYSINKEQGVYIYERKEN